jgi:hypothetical protein
MPARACQNQACPGLAAPETPLATPVMCARAQNRFRGAATCHTAKDLRDLQVVPRPFAKAHRKKVNLLAAVRAAGGLRAGAEYEGGGGPFKTVCAIPPSESEVVSDPESWLASSDIRRFLTTLTLRWPHIAVREKPLTPREAEGRQTPERIADDVRLLRKHAKHVRFYAVVVNPAGIHWTLVLLSLDDNVVEVYDSLAGEGDGGLTHALAGRVQDAIGDGASIWRSTHAPQGEDGNQCGMYVLWYLVQRTLHGAHRDRVDHDAPDAAGVRSLRRTYFSPDCPNSYAAASTVAYHRKAMSRVRAETSTRDNPRPSEHMTLSSSESE